MVSVSKILALGLALGSTAVLAGPTYVEFSTGNNLVGLDDNWASSLYINNSIKISDRYSIVPELITTIQYSKAGQGDFDLSHGAARVYLKDRGLARLGNWKVGITYRYNLPTTNSAQQQGSLGAVMVRPDFSNKWGRFALLIRPVFSVALQRNAYALNTKDNPAKGNPLYFHALEILPEFAITDNWNLSANYTPSGTYTMAAQGSTEGSWSHLIYQEYELGYLGPATLDTSVSVGFSMLSKPFGKDFALATRNDSRYFLKLGREF